MSGVYYATPGTGKLAYAIGWIDLGTLNLNPPMGPIPLTYSLPGGVTFNVSVSTTGSGLNTRTDAIPTWSGAAMGIKGYLNIGGTPAIHGNGSGRVNINLANIVLKDRFGVTIPNYALYIADAEATASTQEGISFSSPGRIINQVDAYPADYPCPGMMGNGTSTITIGWTGQACSGLAYNSRIFQVTSPDSVTGSLYTAGGGEALALGISIQQIKVLKNVQGRLDATDQFELSVIGNVTTSTITIGSSNGVQGQVVEYFGLIDEGLFVTEAMAQGSKNKINQYSTTVTIANTAGGSIPTGQILNNTIPLEAGDFFVVQITNTPIIPYITPIKSVDKSFAFQGDTLTYTIVLPNTSPNDGINSVLIDTVPVGTTFINNSVTINGQSTTENLPAINVGRIKSNGDTTVTFQVTVNTVNPIIPIVYNSSALKYSYNLVNSVPSLQSLSNTVSTEIGARPKINGVKSVDLNAAKLNYILTYTVAFTNLGAVSINNLNFIDTIPDGTTFLPNSLYVNGNNLANGVVSGAGINISNPSSLNPGDTLTITFKVTVTSIFAKNPYENMGTLAYSYVGGQNTFTGITDTNKVDTIVKYLDTTLTKYVDKRYADVGDIINYTLVLKTVGNMVGENIIFKDTVPKGTSLIGNSIYFNGTNLVGVNIESGISLGKVQPNTINTILFSVRINQII